MLGGGKIILESRLSIFFWQNGLYTQAVFVLGLWWTVGTRIVKCREYKILMNSDSMRLFCDFE